MENKDLQQPQKAPVPQQPSKPAQPQDGQKSEQAPKQDSEKKESSKSGLDKSGQPLSPFTQSGGYRQSN